MLENHSECVKSYLAALELEANSPECHFNLGTVYSDMKQFEDSIKHYKESIKIDPSNMDAHICLSNAY